MPHNARNDAEGRSWFVAAVVLIAAVHFAAYVFLFGTVFAYGDANKAVPHAYGIAITVLGWPLFPLAIHVMESLPSGVAAVLGVAGSIWPLFVIAVCNSLIWGVVICGAFWAARRRILASHPPSNYPTRSR